MVLICWIVGRLHPHSAVKAHFRLFQSVSVTHSSTERNVFRGLRIDSDTLSKREIYFHNQNKKTFKKKQLQTETNIYIECVMETIILTNYDKGQHFWEDEFSYNTPPVEILYDVKLMYTEASTGTHTNSNLSTDQPVCCKVRAMKGQLLKDIVV